MSIMTSSPQLLVQGHRHATTPVIVHQSTPHDRNRKNVAVPTGKCYALELGTDVSQSRSRRFFAACEPQNSDDDGRTVITYGFAEPRASPNWPPQEWCALEYKVSRPLRNITTHGSNKRSTATPSNDDGRVETRRVRTPPPAPRPTRLPTPDLSDLECDFFCTCCKSTNENVQLVKARSKASSGTKSGKGTSLKYNTYRERSKVSCSSQHEVRDDRAV